MTLTITTSDGTVHEFPVIDGYLTVDALEFLAVESVLSARVVDVEPDDDPPSDIYRGRRIVG
jgi:hypothetical protein